MLHLALCLLATTASPAPSSAPFPTPNTSTGSTSTSPASVDQAVAADTIATLGAALSALRTEVDAAADDVSRARRAANDDLAALERRRRDLEARLAESDLLTRELQSRQSILAAAAEAAQKKTVTARAPVDEALLTLRRQAERVPFRTHGRLERLAAAERTVATLPVAAAAAVVWPLVLDEAQLLNETARVRQPITVGKESIVAEVAHVGPLVFWKARDGRVGTVVPADAGTRFVELTDAESRQRLALLFEGLRRDSGQGTYIVPNPLARTGTGESP